MRSAPGPQPEAHRLYLKGRYFWYKRTEQGIRKGIEYFDHAIAQDPRYAAAYAGLADCHALLSCRGFIAPNDGFPLAEAAAAKAITFNDTLGEAHASLAHVRLHRRQWDNLERALTHAIELNPSHVMAYHWYSEYLLVRGRFPESVTVMRQAEQLDPLSPIMAGAQGAAYYFARDYERAAEALERGLELEPNHFLLHHRRGWVALQQRQYDRAIEEMQRSVALSDRSAETLTGLAQAYAAADRGEDLREVLAEIEQQARVRYVSPYSMAKIFAQTEPELAFEWLKRACADDSADVIEVAVDPLFDGLRGDARFPEFVASVGLPLIPVPA